MHFAFHINRHICLYLLGYSCKHRSFYKLVLLSGYLKFFVYIYFAIQVNRVLSYTYFTLQTTRHTCLYIFVICVNRGLCSIHCVFILILLSSYIKVFIHICVSVHINVKGSIHIDIYDHANSFNILKIALIQVYLHLAWQSIFFIITSVKNS